MKSFTNLIHDVQKPGLCHRCGGCVTFCSAVNFGALELDAEGKPRYAGLCYTICPEIDELNEETRQTLGWSPPIGRVIETVIARATDQSIRAKATDGGVVTALLVHLFKSGRIDGAIVTRQTGPFQREPFLAMSEADIRDAAGFFFDTSQGMKRFSDYYLTYSQFREFNPLIQKGLQRVAFVGTPCQIRAVRRMQILNIIPADSIKFCLGLFCSGNFVFGEKQRDKLAKIGGFQWDDVSKINIKTDLIIHLNSGETKHIMLDELEFMKRFACYFCPDYSARAVMADARSKAIEVDRQEKQPGDAAKALKQIRTWSASKSKAAEKNRKSLGKKYPDLQK
jgi:coenzyme F420 hydrogenase subunit beta